LTIVHLPNGPTSHFKLTSIRLSSEISVGTALPAGLGPGLGVDRS